MVDYLEGKECANREQVRLCSNYYQVHMHIFLRFIIKFKPKIIVFISNFSIDFDQSI